LLFGVLLPYLMQVQRNGIAVHTLARSTVTFRHDTPAMPQNYHRKVRCGESKRASAIVS
jgi:hypothetical protein